MDTAQIIVTLSGLLLSTLVAWYFFFAKKEGKAAKLGATGIQELEVTVKGGYEPSVIEVLHDKPVRLKLYRDETSSCSEEIVFGDFGIRRMLPAYETTTVEFTPKKIGAFEFTCGMNMLRGKLIVK